MDDIFPLLRDRLVKTAEERLARARALLVLDSPQGTAIASELHALAGEASVVGAAEMADVARTAERVARAWTARAEAADASRVLCESALNEVDAALKRI